MTATTSKLNVGDIAPDFTLFDRAGKSVTLSSFRGSKAIIFFYPEALTPACTKEACDFSDNFAVFKQAGYEIIGISRDLPEKLQRFSEKFRLTYTLLSDPDTKTHQAYGAFGVKKLYGKDVTGVIRSTFIIDETGHITHQFTNIKATGHVERVTRDLGLLGSSSTAQGSASFVRSTTSGNHGRGVAVKRGHSRPSGNR